jgi:DNA-binding transcriptional MerR regulator
MATYTIGQVAERSGFSPSALRYYERVGLVEPSTRTGAGYRVYDDGALVRLAFIARAKQLGCTLDEITDLAGVWDGERCGPVQKRFHDLITTKLAEAERQIVELTTLTGQLREAAAMLAGPATDAPCNEECACRALDGVVASAALGTKGRTAP